MPRKGGSIPGDPFMQESTLDKDDCFVLSKGCDYLLRTLDSYPCLDRYVLEFACWLLGPRLFELSQELTRSLCKRQLRA